MNRYQVQVKINGKWLRTVIYADSDVHARLIAQYQYGINNAPFAPLKIG